MARVAALASVTVFASLAVAQQTAGKSGSAAPVSTMAQPAVARELVIPAAQLTPEQVKTLQGRLADWPGLTRYRAEDAAMGPPKPGEQRVVFFGDSITDAWGRMPGRGRFFPDKGWINRGISGQTTPQMLVRFRQDVLDLKPKVVVILAGINDIAGNTGAEPLGEIEGDFQSMVELARAEGVRVVLSSVLPASKIPWRPGVDPRDEVAALNEFLQKLAVQDHLVYLDYYTAMVGPDRGTRPTLTVDGVHPNDAGYAVMEPLARAAVASALSGPQP